MTNPARAPEHAREWLQEFYNVTTWLISVAPTGRVDLGATQPYHDALVVLTNLRDELRRATCVTHDESYWHKHLKGAAVAPVEGPS